MASPNTAYLQSGMQIGLSIAPETAVNTPYSLAAEFEGVLMDAVNPPLPDFELINDDDQVGDGSEFAKNARNYYLQQPSFPFNGKVNCESMARILRRFLGGTVTESTVAAGVYDHSIIMQKTSGGTNPGIIPQLSTVPVLLGGNDMIWASMAVDQFSITQQLAGEPRFSSQLIGTGYHKRIRDVYRTQIITITGSPTGGTFTLTFNGQTTAPIAYNAINSAVASALAALTNLDATDITVTGGPGPATPYQVAFISSGIYANADVPLMTGSGALLTATGTVTITPSATALVIPQPPTYHYMHGAALLAVMNDGTSIDLTSQGLLQFQIQMNQNIQVLRLPGNPFINPADFDSGAYPDFIRRGKRTVVPSFKLFLDGTLPEYYYRRKNLSITSLVFTMRGPLIGATTYHHEVEITIPASKVSGMTADVEGDMAAKTITMMPTKDATSGGIATARVRNGTATLT